MLDPDALTAALQLALPEVELRAVRITYLRYKASTSCLASCRFLVGDNEVHGFVQAYQPSESDKLQKAARKPGVDGAMGRGRFVLAEHAMVVSVFPNDGDIKELSTLGDGDRRRELFRDLLPGRDDLDGSILERLAYKPKRRYVGAVITAAGPALVVRAYAPAGYASAAARRGITLTPGSTLAVAQCVAAEPRRAMLMFEWLDGTQLTDVAGDEQERERVFRRVGLALAELHRGQADASSVPRVSGAADLISEAEALGTMWPPLSPRATDVARRVASLVDAEPAAAHTLHGDFHPAQTLIQGERVAILDFDRSGLGPAAYDLGTFIAHLERDGLTGRLRKESVERLSAALIDGYGVSAPAPSASSIRHHTAAALLRLSPEPFRYRDPNWPGATVAIVDRAAELISPPTLRAAKPSPAVLPVIEDPYGVLGDTAMPCLALALDPIEVRRQFECDLQHIINGGRLNVHGIRVTRHKPARRCVIEYDVEIQQPGLGAEHLTLVGKVRARGLDTKTFACLASLWRNGFDAGSADGISVAEPLGLVPALQMGVQRKVPGTPATQLLPGASGVALARRITDAIDKLHRLGPPPARRHTMADELAILRPRLTAVADLHPMLEPRLVRLLDSCERVGAAMPEPRCVGVHRDFYPDQVLVDGPRLYLLDLDLYAMGDPALDVGNFIAHLVEQGLRVHGDAGALSAQISAMEERFSALSGDLARARVYVALTLARHISISTLFPERRWTTPALLELAERAVDASLLESASPVSTLGGMR
jgi:Ser/Thr protein kinase RdoA (MazF antagonist)